MSRISLLLSIVTCLGTWPLAAEEPATETAWDEFGVAMSQDEEAPETGAVQFTRGGGSLRLTPSPVFTAGIAKPHLTLDGTWYFRSVAPDDFQNLPESEVAAWDRVEVPGDYRMQGHGGGTVAYVRYFTLPEPLRLHELQRVDRCVAARRAKRPRWQPTFRRETRACFD